MNNPENKSLKDYTDQELIDEITNRINNLSLKDVNCLIYPLVIIGSQYLAWYGKEKKKSQEKQATE